MKGCVPFLLLLFGVPCESFLARTCSSRGLVCSSRQDDCNFPSPDNDNSDSLDRHHVQWDLRNLLSSDKLLASHLLEIYQAVQKKNLDPTKPIKTVPGTLEVNEELQKVRSFLQNYSTDWNHGGRFGINQQYSLQSNLVFAMDHPLQYLQTIGMAQPPTNHKEVVVFCPDYNVPLAQATRQKQYLSQVLDGMPLSVVLPGVQDSLVEVPLPADTVLALRTNRVFQETMNLPVSPIVDGLYQFDPNLLRAVVAWQPSAAEIDPLMETLIKLIDVAVESVRTGSTTTNPSLVLLVYSVTARAVGAAISQWKQQVTSAIPSSLRKNRGGFVSMEQAESLLRQAVTVVTIGGLCPVFPHGPAYIHVSMLDDPLAVELGVGTTTTTTTTTTTASSSSTATTTVVLNALSPYDATTTTNAHNPEAAAIQFLSLVLRRNGLHSFRQLYEMGRQPTPQLDIASSLFAIPYNHNNKVGLLDLPCDDLLTSMIQATGGARWLETPLEEDDDSLPDPVWAEATIAQHFGYGVYQEIVEACQSDKEQEEDQ